jgi:hypothetical protein
MKKIVTSLGWIALLAIVLTNQVRADMIVDTGTPTPSSSDLVLNGAQGWATEFSTTQDREVHSIEGFINADSANPDSAMFTVALYGNDANNLPDTTGELFSQQAIFTGDGWNGVQGLNFTLNAGTYWVAFEVRSADEVANRLADTLQGLMPVSAPNPLLKTAWSDTSTNFGYSLASGANYDIGVRMVPTPPILLMLVPGLLAMRKLRKRQSV